MKKSCLSAIIAFILIPVLLVMLPQAVNDIACLSYRAEVEATLSGAEYIEVIEIASACGNTSGTGDHTELWVGVIIKSNLSLDELTALFGAEVSLYDEIDKLDSWQDKFSADVEGGADGYYLLEFIKTAPMSWFDLRGM